MCHVMDLVPFVSRESLLVNLLSSMEANFHRPKHYSSTMHVLKNGASFGGTLHGFRHGHSINMRSNPGY